MTEQKFLQDLEKKLWTSVNKLLPSLEATVNNNIDIELMVTNDTKNN